MVNFTFLKTFPFGWTSFSSFNSSRAPTQSLSPYNFTARSHSSFIVEHLGTNDVVSVSNESTVRNGEPGSPV